MYYDGSYALMSSQAIGDTEPAIDIGRLTGEPSKSNEPRYQKTGLQGFRPGLTHTGLCSHRRWLEV